ncbi:MAG: triose-phosphate isomerase, partial [Candidatus Nanoarchaeia archaeon]
QASGKQAVQLARTITNIRPTQAKILMSVQAPDIFACANTTVPILAQHVDVEEPGSHTGKINIKSLVENKAVGSIVNHCENKIPFKQIAQTIALLQEAGLLAIVCVQNPKEAKKVAKLAPDMIAIEPAQLIGGTISVTNAKPELLTKTLKAVETINENIPLLCGAGIKNQRDMQTALDLGYSGVLVASGVVKAKDQKAAIEELAIKKKEKPTSKK